MNWWKANWWQADWWASNWFAGAAVPPTPVVVSGGGGASVTRYWRRQQQYAMLLRKAKQAEHQKELDKREALKAAREAEDEGILLIALGVFRDLD